MYSPKKSKIDFIDLSLYPTRKRLIVDGHESDPLEIMIASNFLLSRDRQGNCRLKIPTSHDHYTYVANWKTGITSYKLNQRVSLYLKKGFFKREPGILFGERSNASIYILTNKGKKYFAQFTSLLVLGNPYQVRIGKDKKSYKPSGKDRERRILNKYSALLNKSDIRTPELDYPWFFKLTRVFSGTYGRGGRIFHDLQFIKSIERAKMSIEGEETVEIDIVNCQLQILCALVDKPFKALEIPSDTKLDRKIYKKAMLIMFNSKSRRNALMAIYSVLYELQEGRKPQDFFINGPLLDLAKEIVAYLESFYSEVSSEFYKNSSGPFQFSESRICFALVEIFLKAKIPMVPVHDAFIVKKSQKDILISNLREVTLKLFGREFVVSEK